MKERESKKLPITVRVAAAAFGTVAVGSFAGCGEDVNLAFSGVCSEKQGVNRAADYVDDILNPVVILDSKGETHDWTDKVPEKWRAQSIEDTEMVACLNDIWVVDRICEYIGGPDVKLMSNGVHVQVREAKTGDKIASGDFWGSEPPQDCRGEEPRELTRRTVSKVSFKQVWEWLQVLAERRWR